MAAQYRYLPALAWAKQRLRLKTSYRWVAVIDDDSFVFPRRLSRLLSTYDASTPLHFGDFGGLALKWLYFLLGMTPAFLSISGTLIWLDARQQRRREADAAQLAADEVAAAG